MESPVFFNAFPALRVDGKDLAPPHVGAAPGAAKEPIDEQQCYLRANSWRGELP
jgi:hypothetical protein